MAKVENFVNLFWVKFENNKVEKVPEKKLVIIHRRRAWSDVV